MTDLLSIASSNASFDHRTQVRGRSLFVSNIPFSSMTLLLSGADVYFLLLIAVPCRQYLLHPPNFWNSFKTMQDHCAHVQSFFFLLGRRERASYCETIICASRWMSDRISVLLLNDAAQASKSLICWNDSENASPKIVSMDYNMHLIVAVFCSS